MDIFSLGGFIACFITGIIFGWSMMSPAGFVTLENCEEYDPNIHGFDHADLEILMKALYKLESLPNSDKGQIEETKKKLRVCRDMVEFAEVEADPSICRQY